ncbi:glucose-methanol-choline oxidoreductase (plasmid) [Azospirillum sp. B510]|uniref:GMC family oxidoreductase n=1 Tax=Azospirillum sp. (strain B510) TaxID=137722 RepID=UPI0001C4CACD|nr:GMC family oxidoreductase N-terminal domain-containing protein [Azospirillum sp. B510]BAI75799.1 glucose-methanol-choline oxidoreductase [Azospirillum sp. B510]
MVDVLDFGGFDYIIAGGGTAGCVLANRLSADPEISVLLLEAGGKDDWIWLHIPAGYLFCIGNPRTDWCFKTEAEPGLNGRSIHYARGKVLGGCSSINGMIAMRGQARDYDEWAALTGDSRWSWREVLPVFKGSEDYWRGADELHGAGGEWRVERQRLRWDLLDRFAEAAQQLGIPRNDDFNRGDNLGVGSFEVNQKGGVRWSAAKAFLRPALDRPNLKLAIDAAIDRVEIADGRVTGIRFTMKGEPARAAARIETVLAAGAIGSPAILQRSGIGPAEHLRKLGIPVLLDAPDVGANLQDHLQLRMIYKVDGIVTLNKRAGSLFGKAMMGLEYALFRKGPLTMAPSQLGVFARSSPEVATADLEYHVQPLSLEKFGDPLHPFPAFTASVCDLRPASRGWTRITTADHRANPAIAPCYLSDPADRAKAAKALALTRRIVAQPALAPYHPQEYKPGPAFQSEEELARAAGDIGTTIFHPVGTCRMGAKDDPTAVTDSEMRVRGLRGLRVIDASVMPTLTSGNTNTPTVMIAERGAALMRADRRAARRE